MAASLPHIVRERAAGRCEYCRLPQAATSVPFEIDHIISRKHHGPTIASNLASACWYCNSFKGSDISGLDPKTRKVTRLFHPRRHKWSHHFRYEGAVLIGRTAIGRTTIRVLQINCDEAVTLRESLIADGLFVID
jgi:HNH endonuclease